MRAGLVPVVLVVAVVVAVTLMAACGGNPPPQAPAPALAPPIRTELVVLATDPDTGLVGRLDVSSPSGTVALTEARASTSIAAGAGLTPVRVLSDADVQQAFGMVIAALPPAAQDFNLYFETGGDVLTAESQAALPGIIAEARGRVAVGVSVVGHTDSTGAAAANAALGLRRATSVRDLLVAAGLDPAVVETASHGESDPLVPAPDNTDEPRNRRVAVTVR